MGTALRVIRLASNLLLDGNPVAGRNLPPMVTCPAEPSAAAELIPLSGTLRMVPRYIAIFVLGLILYTLAVPVVRYKLALQSVNISPPVSANTSLTPFDGSLTS